MSFGPIKIICVKPRPYEVLEKDLVLKEVSEGIHPVYSKEYKRKYDMGANYYRGMAESMYGDISVLETVEQVIEEFERLMDEPKDLKFEDIKIKLHKKRDLHAFLLLDRLTSKSGLNMITDADHDIIYLEPDPEDLVGCTKNSIAELYACGVFIFDKQYLVMFT